MNYVAEEDVVTFQAVIIDNFGPENQSTLLRHVSTHFRQNWHIFLRDITAVWTKKYN